MRSEHSVQQIFCREMISFEIFLFGFRLCDSSEMVDILNILNCCGQYLSIEQIAIYIFNRKMFNPLEVGSFAHKAAELISFVVKCFCEMAADESCRAGDECFHGRW